MRTRANLTFRGTLLFTAAGLAIATTSMIAPSAAHAQDEQACRAGEDPDTNAEPSGSTECGEDAEARDVNSTAIGFNAIADAMNSVALGANSYVDEADAVSVGNRITGLTRKIINVTDGELSATSTDAVTGAQLFATNETVDAHTTLLGDIDFNDGEDRGDAFARQQATAIGPGANASARYGIAIGNGATTLQNDPRGGGNGWSIAIGYQAEVRSSQGVALGADTLVTGTGATAIGDFSRALADDGAALGQGAQARALNSTALGADAIVYEGSDGSVAIGKNSRASASSAAAIGLNSIAEEADTVSFGRVAIEDNPDTDADETRTAITRRLINISDGIDDSDAATIGQLNSATQYVTVNSTSNLPTNTGTESIAIGGGAEATAAGATALGGDTDGNGRGARANAANATAIGNEARATMDGATALGAGAFATGQTALALGPGATASQFGAVGLGSGTVAEHQFSVALGAASRTGGEFEISVGAGPGSPVEFTRKITNVTDGTADTDAATVGQLNALAAGGLNFAATNYLDGEPGSTATGDNSYAVGDGAMAEGTGAIALGGDSFDGIDTDDEGAKATGDYSMALGADASAGGNLSFAFGPGASSSGTNSMALGTRSSAIGVGSLALGFRTQANGTTSAAIGPFAQALFDNSTAIGFQAATTRANQIVLGTISQTITLPGLPRAGSNNAQSGSLFYVTVDANGNLGFTDIPSTTSSTASAPPLTTQSQPSSIPDAPALANAPTTAPVGKSVTAAAPKVSSTPTSGAAAVPPSNGSSAPSYDQTSQDGGPALAAGEGALLAQAPNRDEMIAANGTGDGAASMTEKAALPTAEQSNGRLEAALFEETQDVPEPPENADVNAGTRKVATSATSSNPEALTPNSIPAVSQVSAADFSALTDRVTTLEGQVNTLFDLSSTIDRDARRGIASIAAQAQPHFPSEPGKTSYASNVAVYRGEIGVSAGLMHRFEGDFAITAGVTYAGGNSTSVRAGIAGEF
jgi:autotransporter adhesin